MRPSDRIPAANLLRWLSSAEVFREGGRRQCVGWTGIAVFPQVVGATLKDASLLTKRVEDVLAGQRPGATCIQRGRFEGRTLPNSSRADRDALLCSLVCDDMRVEAGLQQPDGCGQANDASADNDRCRWATASFCRRCSSSHSKNRETAAMPAATAAMPAATAAAPAGLTWRGYASKDACSAHRRGKLQWRMAATLALVLLAPSRDLSPHAPGRRDEPPATRGGARAVALAAAGCRKGCSVCPVHRARPAGRTPAIPQPGTGRREPAVPAVPEAGQVDVRVLP